jgi:hypothetical protein
MCEAAQGVLRSIVKPQVAVGDLSLMSHRGIHEVAGPTQHIAHTVLVLKILGAKDTRLVRNRSSPGYRAEWIASLCFSFPGLLKWSLLQRHDWELL